MKTKAIWVLLYSVIFMGIGGFILFMFTAVAVSTSPEAVKLNPLLTTIEILFSIFLLLGFVFSFIGSIGLLFHKAWACSLNIRGMLLSNIAAIFAFTILTWCNIVVSGLKLTFIYQAIILFVLLLIYFLPAMILRKSLRR